MNGLLFIYVTDGSFALTTGTLDELTKYTFNTKSYFHHFCPTCGTEIIGGAGQRIGINVRTVDGIDLAKLKLDWYDGKTLL
ncbi:GFA domain-containing protein [Phanerochaete sordida]|uniref:GFA domain-containing protein n=1 Tax=Phanerochaete sordida TaxID=48140 RepID=A0A9P3G914_9APHY|nr:GFA domain-containing protein [Phanerochaete sordida]